MCVFKIYEVQKDIILARKNSQGKLSICLSLSFHNYKIVFKYESLLLFKLNLSMVPIGKKPTPSDHESSLKIFLARYPCAIFFMLLHTRYLFKISLK